MHGYVPPHRHIQQYEYMWTASAGCIIRIIMQPCVWHSLLTPQDPPHPDRSELIRTHTSGYILLAIVWVRIVYFWLYPLPIHLLCPLYPRIMPAL